jgi:hypothetical protein
VEAGVYLGCRIGISGGQSAHKVLQAAAGAHVLINKPGPKNRHNSIIEVENFGGIVTDWVISGFEVANSPKYRIDVRVTDRITVEGNHVHASALTGIFTAFSNDILIQGIITASTASIRATVPRVQRFAAIFPITTPPPAFT